MADKETTSAVHLTSLDLDISTALKTLQELNTAIAENAEKARTSYKNIFEGLTINTGGSGDFGLSMKKSAEEADSAITITKKNLESLYGQYLQLEKTIANFRAANQENGSTFKAVSDSVQDALTVLSKYRETNENIITIAEEDSNAFRTAQESVREYKNEIQLLDNELIKSGEAFDKQVKKITSLSTSFNNFLSGLNKSGFDSSNDIFSGIQKKAEETAGKVDELKKSIIENGGATQEQALLMSNYSRTLYDLKNQFSLLKESVPIREFENLKTKYEQFLLTLSKSKLDASAGSALSGIKTEANSAAQAIEKLINEVRKNGNATKTQVQQLETLNNKLRQLKGNLMEAETHARETGEGFSDMGSKAQQSGNKAADFLNKLSDKAKWMAAYKLINLVYTSISNIPGAIIETENAVIELQRVLNENIGASAISDELYKIAYDFGQSFQNVQETAVKFAQTGMDWKDVIDATRATMLGLNTAELEVSTATEGLIAVISQFNLDASDLQDVIDKINITADNFAVTSEKIVAALQRSGASANAAGMSLEQTIGVITALSEATGRAGANIGTALNSIISFTTNQSALKTFEEFLGLSSGTLQGQNPLAIWKALGDEIKGNEAALADMMAQSEEFASLFNAEIAEALDLTGQFNEALANNEDVYSAAGTYRKTYFIALLNNIDTAIEAIDNMTNATGYSLSENERAMDTFSKKWEQLVASVRELAVQLGDAGLLDLMKWLVDVTAATAKLTKSFGGFKTAMWAVSTVFLALKKTKIDNMFEKVGTAIKLVRAAQNAYNTAMLLGYTRTEALKISMSTLGLTMGNVFSAFTFVATIISAVTGKMEAARQEAARLREEAIQTGKEAKEQAESVYDAYNKYLSASTTEEKDDSVKGLFNVLGYTESDIAVLIDRYGDLDKAIQKVLEDQYKQIKNDALEARKAAKESFEAFDITEIEKQYRTDNSVDEYQYLMSKLVGTTTIYGEKIEKVADAYNYYLRAIRDGVTDFEDAQEKYSRLTAAINLLNGKLTESEKQTNSYYLEMLAVQENLEDMIEAYELSGAQLEMLGDSWEDYVQNMERSKEKIQESIEAMSNGTAELSDFETVIKSLSDAYDDLSGRVDSFQSAYSTAVSVIDEYNNNGYMTADMLQKLLQLEPEYLELLEFKNGQMQINQEVLSGLIDTNDNYLKQMAAMKTAEQAVAEAEAMRTAIEQGLTFAEYQQQAANIAAVESLEGVIQSQLAGAYSATEFSAAVRSVGEGMGLSGEYLEKWTEQITQMTDRMNEFMQKINFKTLPTYWRKNSTSVKKETDKIKNLADAFNDTISDYEHKIYLMEKNNKPATAIANMYKDLQERVHDQAEKYRKMGLDDNSDYIQALQKQWWKFQEEIEKIYTGMYEGSVKAYQNALSLLENQYEKVEGRENTEGMVMNLQKQLEYQKKIQQEAHAEAERLRKLGVKENDDAVQSCIKAWWSAEDAIQNINSKIEESVLSTFDDFIDLADYFEAWDDLDFTKLDYLQQKTAAINGLYQQGTISVQRYKELIEETAKAMYEAKKAELEREKDDIEEYYDSLIDGYNDEIDHLKELQNESDDYYDSLIEKLRDVEESNDRINEQLDYYIQRQKILTNIEQAQSRSGVEWRQKEMEYQQELADLDEDWRRKQEEWNISDQIERIEKMKQAARDDLEESIKQIQEYISEAEQASKDALAGIDYAIESLGKKIYDSLQKGLNTGIGYIAAENTMNAANDVINAIEQVKPVAIEKSNELALSVRDTIRNALVGENGAAKRIAKEWSEQFYSPISTNIEAIGDKMINQLVQDGTIAATALMDTFKGNFINPLKSEIQSVMLLNMAAMQSYANRVSAMASTYDYRTTNNNATTNLYANIGSTSIADAFANSIADKTKFSTNPARR